MTPELSNIYYVQGQPYFHPVTLKRRYPLMMTVSGRSGEFKGDPVTGLFSENGKIVGTLLARSIGEYYGHEPIED